MAQVNKQHVFAADTVILASEHNENFDDIYNEFNGSISNTNISDSAAIGNTKLAAPKAYFTMTFCRDGQFSSTVDPIFTFQMPFAATLTEVSVCARDIDTATNETYTFDLEEAGTSVLSSAISIAADNTPVVGTVSDSSLADNAKIEGVLTLGGTTPTLDDLTVLLVFKIAHCA